MQNTNTEQSGAALDSQVVITDIKMPFWSMVWFLVKLSFAAIPALLIVWLVFALIGAVFGGVVGALGLNLH